MATVALDCSVIGNEARAGEYLAGQFLCGVDPGGRLAAQTTVSSIVLKPLDAAFSGQGAVTASAVRTVGFSTSVAGVGQIAAQSLPTKGFGASVAGQATVTHTLNVLVLVTLEARIQTVVPICGENLCNVLAIGGPLICGGSSGPHALVHADFVRNISWLFTPIEGKAQVGALMRPSTPFAAAVQGQAVLAARLNHTFQFGAEIAAKAEILPWLILKLTLAAAIQGKADLRVKINLDWLGPTVPVDEILVPTEEENWILVPTEEEDWLLVPTVERTM